MGESVCLRYLDQYCTIFTTLSFDVLPNDEKRGHPRKGLDRPEESFGVTIVRDSIGTHFQKQLCVRFRTRER